MLRPGSAKHSDPNRIKVLDSVAQERKLYKKARKKYERKLQGIHLSKPSIVRNAARAQGLAEFYKMKILSPKQHKAIAFLSDFMNCWSPDYICGQVGITRKTLYEWRNDPFFLKELDREITKRRTTFRMEAHRQLFKQIRKGKPQLLLAYLKMTGDFAERVEHIDGGTKVSDDIDDKQIDQEIDRLQSELGVVKVDGTHKV